MDITRRKLLAFLVAGVATVVVPAVIKTSKSKEKAEKPSISLSFGITAKGEKS